MTRHPDETIFITFTVKLEHIYLNKYETKVFVIQVLNLYKQF